MALVSEHPYNGREDRIKHYSDSGMMIRKNETGVLYEEAIDKYPCKYTYTETDEPIPEPDEVIEE